MKKSKYASGPSGPSGLPYRDEAGRLRHNERQREKQRNAYRLKHGIPLDAPIQTRGPKIGVPLAKDFASQPLKYYWQ